jgi:hypothetical protein
MKRNLAERASPSLRGRGRQRRCVLGVGAWLVASVVAVPGVLALRPPELDFERLVACRWAVEEVYWRHRIWPESNPGAKPPLAAVLPREVVAARMDDALRQVSVLADGWNLRIDAAALARELGRMARQSRDPALLRELFAAAGSGEAAALCLALPELAKSRLADLYAEDAELHRPLREAAAAALEVEADFAALEDHGAEVTLLELVRGERAEGPGLEGRLVLDEAQWRGQLANLAGAFADPARGLTGSGRVQIAAEEATVRLPALPVGRRSQLVETLEAFVVHEVREASGERLVVATASWRKVPVDTWWQERREEVARAEVEAAEVSLPEITATACVDDTWTPTAVDDLPSPRRGHVAVWTGTEMLVWGGYDNQSMRADGGRYTPATDSWLPMSGTGAPSARWLATAVWTGQQMLVWGGAASVSADMLGSGGRYTPATDQWLAISTASPAPTPRFRHTAVWTGSQMIVWGGLNAFGFALGSGAIYTPTSNLWSAMDGTPPPARYWASAVWTGTQMVVWGGENTLGQPLQDGGAYTPGSPGSWAPISGTGAPSARALHTAVWAGPPVQRMIVWGGRHGPSTVLASGAVYDPLSDSWGPLASSGAPSGRFYHSATWTGSEMVVWGGTLGETMGLSNGARYDPVADSWEPTGAVGAPSPRYLHTAVWTGQELIVWGGYHSGAHRDSGGRYDPGSDSWTPTTASRTPANRTAFASAWTGVEMVVWGGYSGPTTFADGALYRPATDLWSELSRNHPLAPAAFAEAVWTGVELLVWGGADNVWAGNEVYLAQGARYGVVSDSWLPIPPVGAPSPRYFHTAVWTGSEMIVWGGYGEGYWADGGAYAPDVGWRILPQAPLSGRGAHSAVWTGSEMLVWGGQSCCVTLENDGARYVPALDSWLPMATAEAPSVRFDHTAVWTGHAMIVWGGRGASWWLATGGIYRPDLDLWVPINPAGAPDPRRAFTAVWTGAEMIVWGGNEVSLLDSGGRYDLARGAWRATSQLGAPAARMYHAAFWTGDEMLVWGSHSQRTGGRYCAVLAASLDLLEDDFETGDAGAWSTAAP